MDRMGKPQMDKINTDKDLEEKKLLRHGGIIRRWDGKKEMGRTGVNADSEHGLGTSNGKKGARAGPWHPNISLQFERIIVLYGRKNERFASIKCKSDASVDHDDL
jgi:hypothetical protein